MMFRAKQIVFQSIIFTFSVPDIYNFNILIQQCRRFHTCTPLFLHNFTISILTQYPVNYLAYNYPKFIVLEPSLAITKYIFVFGANTKTIGYLFLVIRIDSLTKCFRIR